MSRKKKTKTEEPFTPQDLKAMSTKTDKMLGRYEAIRDAEAISKDTKVIKKVLVIMLSIILSLLVIWLISMFVTQWGDLVINTDRNLLQKGFVMSTTEDFKKTAIQLSAPHVKDVTNITYDWLPKDLDKHEGSHNGDNYLAYTFYLKNGGTKSFDYTGTMEITGSANGMDEAVRIMIYKNGEPLIYAKPQYKNRKQAETGTIAFLDDTTVMNTMTKDFKPGAVDKYTIVIWVEGNDSECVNDILGGYIRSKILFEVADDKENASNSIFA